MGLTPEVQQNARSWFQEYNNMPETDQNARGTTKCPGRSQEYIKMPEADPSRQEGTLGFLFYIPLWQNFKDWSEKEIQITTNV